VRAGASALVHFISFGSCVTSSGYICMSSTLFHDSFQAMIKAVHEQLIWRGGFPAKLRLARGFHAKPRLVCHTKREKS
jgi:hypothetical protein